MPQVTGTLAGLRARIKEAVQLRITLEEVRVAASVSRVTLWRWCHGKTTPSSEELARAEAGIIELIRAQRKAYGVDEKASK